MALKHYISIARPNHWFKNIFILPGVILATLLTHKSWQEVIFNLFVGFLVACLIASANYTINEWLDAEFDRYHPLRELISQW
ncbi:MAG: hypothetical protein P4L74_03320 [Candidatus Doudnabacteria bacterium]|nr:hypothetical protein [Candidatus Doudnabacteria bacterium]